MGPFDAFWHVLNLLAPAVGVGLIAPALAKLLWRQDLRGVRWWALARWTVAASALALLGGLAITGRDGRMGTYGAMVVLAALALWWRGWVRPGRG